MRGAGQDWTGCPHDRVVAFLDACYGPAASAGTWMREIVTAGDALLGDGLGLAAAAFAPESPEPSCIEVAKCDPGWAMRFLSRVAEHEGGLATAADPLAEASSRVRAACRSLGPSASLCERPNALLMHAVHAWEDARDLVCLHACDERGHGLWLGMGRRRRGLSPRRRRLFATAAHHLGNSLRLRHAGARVATFVGREAERLGNVHHARTVLVEGRPWTVVLEHETDGRRHLVLKESEDAAARVVRLTTRERQVLGECARGHHTKLVAYELGLSPATVRVLLGRAVRKLGVATREDAIELYRLNDERA